MMKSTIFFWMRIRECLSPSIPFSSIFRFLRTIWFILIRHLINGTVKIVLQTKITTKCIKSVRWLSKSFPSLWTCDKLKQWDDITSVDEMRKIVRANKLLFAANMFTLCAMCIRRVPSFSCEIHVSTVLFFLLVAAANIDTRVSRTHSVDVYAFVGISQPPLNSTRISHETFERWWTMSVQRLAAIHSAFHSKWSILLHSNDDQKLCPINLIQLDSHWEVIFVYLTLWIVYFSISE